MKIEIMFKDLTKKKQKEIAIDLGYISIEECIEQTNWDTIPLFELEVEDE